MADDAAKLAEFLVEHARSISSDDLLGVIADRFPDLTEGEFIRGFAIAEETVIDDINTAVSRQQPSVEIRNMLEHFSSLRSRGK